ncbi:MAG: proline racemase [Desulfobacteraceae bacterium]|nr:proline racemase [Desulfobacteraceae bacterium]
MHETMRNWRPPLDWPKITTIDAHAAGEPFRVITSGLPEVVGDTLLERRRYMSRHLDDLRTALMWEPRGHADMYGAVVMPPVSADADFSILFLHNEGYSSMCGHGIIAVTKVVLETGVFPLAAPVTTLNIDTPAGMVKACAQVSGGQVDRVSFLNVPSFVMGSDLDLNVPGMGKVTCDIAYGGAFYAYVRALDAGVELRPENMSALMDKGMAVKHAVMAQHPVKHPFEPDLSFLYGTIFVGDAESGNHHSRHVCIFADGEVDRSPTGTGVGGRLAILFGRGEIAMDECITIESIIGTTFQGCVTKMTRFGPCHGIIPEVSGTAHIIGKNEFYLDPADPLKNGFFIR